ncbi:hypothetical protein SRB5_31750 [Streptomyces sp. RB5]|uniref:HTH luxR-type domain-containing protein n=1 Tax=Streptomyces smaragdinus TaxID=2585196 RepID=A0A7K0CHR8_9ACTN|nr:LuxR C-terminal-related transcriptional regulator [Streptomyces smaragdinus]MQY13035.1 hypothetical protein [Streptomyces smaragdinus]
MTDTGDVTMELYRELRFGETAEPARAAAAVGLDGAEAAAHRAELVRLGLIDGDGAVVGPEVALRRLIRREGEAVRERARESARVHAAVEALAERYLDSRVTAPAEERVAVETVTERKRFTRVLADLNAGLTVSEDSMHHLEFGSPLDEGLRRDAAAVERGVRVRCLYSRRLLRVPHMAALFERQTEVGVEVRTAPAVPITMIVVDGHTAMLPLDPARPRDGLVVARAPVLVRSYAALYEYCWMTAAPYVPGCAAQATARLTEEHRTALRMLAGGAKDERIARALGVSPRTVSRILAELMQELGASSRFEAGVRAARLGLLDPDQDLDAGDGG